MMNVYRIIDNILHLHVGVVSELRDFRHADITQTKRNDHSIGGFGNLCLETNVTFLFG